MTWLLIPAADRVRARRVAQRLDEILDIDGTRKRLRQWVADRGWEVRAELPGIAENWAPVAARDGAAGSDTGVPIPEGDE